MCTNVNENQYNGAIMDVQSELDTGYQLCQNNYSDGVNWTTKNSSLSEPPGRI